MFMSELNFHTQNENCNPEATLITFQPEEHHAGQTIQVGLARMWEGCVVESPRGAMATVWTESPTLHASTCF